MFLATKPPLAASSAFLAITATTTIVLSPGQKQQKDHSGIGIAAVVVVVRM